MKPKFLITAAIFGLGMSTTNARASEIVASIERTWELINQTHPTSCVAVSVRTEHAYSASDSVALVAGLAPISSFPVVVELSSLNSIYFTPFAGRLIDGADGILTFRPQIVCDSGTEYFIPTLEHEFDFFDHQTDLAGYELDSIRFWYLDASLDFANGFNAELSVRYEFVGHPIPEPGLGLIAALIGCVGITRRFPRR